MSTYLLINLLSIAIPFAFSFHPRLKFHQRWYAFWPAAILTATVFIAWDVLYTHWGVWGFSVEHLLGWDIAGLPFEEWLFFICIPYASVFTYDSMNILIGRDLFRRHSRWISWILAGALLLIAVLTWGRLYTSVTFLATSIVLSGILIFSEAAYLGRFYLAYLVIHLFPFLVVNGILTGTFLDTPVVWYNDAENLDIRFLTIPLDDFVYGFLLYLSNVSLFEWFIRRRSNAR